MKKKTTLKSLFLFDGNIEDLNTEQQEALNKVIKAFNGNIKFKQNTNKILNQIEN